jgi:alpha-galactosidase
MSPVTQSILTNRAVIAVDQDPLGRQGYPVASSGGHWVLTKPLANGDKAVLFFNQTNTEATISITAALVGVSSASEYSVLNLWSGTSSETTGLISATVPAHGAVFYEIAESTTPPFRA